MFFHRTRIAALAAAALAAAAPSCCFCPGAARGGALETDFRPLFNGTDLTGWVYGTMNGKPNKSGAGYAVRDGVIYCTEKDGGNLFTDRDYSDFIFRFEFKLTENANNGIGIRAPLEGDAAYVGMEIQVLDDGGSEYRTLKPWQYHGSIYGVVAAQRGSQRPVGEWNEEEITARGPHVAVKVNGKTIVDADLREVHDAEILKAHPGLARTAGRIGFLGHGAHVEFRSLRLKEL